MRQKLELHPNSTAAAAAHIEAEFTRLPSGILTLRYLVTGSIDELALPPPLAIQRADELWRHTCLEVFLRAHSGDAYMEFNFAPSRQWASYHFDGYRSGMRNAKEVGPPEIGVNATATTFELSVSLTLGDLPDLPGDVPWEIGLSAVIEQKDGSKSYWALSHPSGKPDFHHSDCFALQIPAALRP